MSCNNVLKNFGWLYVQQTVIEYVAKYSYIFSTGVINFEYFSSLLVFLMASERYILICKPHSADRVLSTSNRKKIYALALFLLLVLIGLEIPDAIYASVKADVRLKSCHPLMG